jgi:hypothetical protein
MIDVEALGGGSAATGVPGFGQVKDLVFLDGYYEPSLLILHERKHTHEG